MSISLSKKKHTVKKAKEIAENAKSIVVTNYEGLSSPELTDLRAIARKENVYLFVAKNKLLKIGFKETAYSNIEKYLKGQSLIFFSQNEISSSAKVVQNFCKNNEKLKVNVISLCGDNFFVKDLKYISSLPTKSEAIVSFISLLKIPVINLIRTVKCPSVKLLFLLKELSKKK